MGMYSAEIMTMEMAGQLLPSTEKENLSSLEHHGIKGQKWGVRRYQDKDGSLTDAGRRRYGVGKTKYRIVAKSPFEKKRAKLEKQEQKMTEKEELWRRKNELKERQANLKNQGKSQKAIQNKSADERRKEQLSKEKERNKRDVKDMTDDELRAFINRYNMEKQYKEIMNSSQTKKGSNVAIDILKKSGSAIAAKYITKAMEVGVEKALKSAGIDLRTSEEKRKDREAQEKKAEERRKKEEETSRNRERRRDLDTNDHVLDSDEMERIREEMARWRRRRNS